MDTYPPDLIEKKKARAKKLYAQAKRHMDRSERYKARLKRFPLLVRVTLYPRFKKLRAAILDDRMASFTYMAMSMSLMRELRLIGRAGRA